MSQQELDQNSSCAAMAEQLADQDLDMADVNSVEALLRTNGSKVEFDNNVWRSPSSRESSLDLGGSTRLAFRHDPNSVRTSTFESTYCNVHFYPNLQPRKKRGLSSVVSPTTDKRIYWKDKYDVLSKQHERLKTDLKEMSDVFDGQLKERTEMIKVTLTADMKRLVDEKTTQAQVSKLFEKFGSNVDSLQEAAWQEIEANIEQAHDRIVDFESRIGELTSLNSIFTKKMVSFRKISE